MNPEVDELTATLWKVGPPLVQEFHDKLAAAAGVPGLALCVLIHTEHGASIFGNMKADYVMRVMEAMQENKDNAYVPEIDQPN